MKLSTLKRQSAEATKFRGHSMGQWHQCGETIAWRRCRVCGAAVSIKTNPMPNEIDIGGEAVAMTCPCNEEV